MHALTADHKPDTPLERARIEATPHGCVQQCGAFLHRVVDRRLRRGGGLSLSRALGDAWAVPLGLTPEPDAASLALPPAAAGHRHALILGCDGLCEGVSNAEAVAAALACATTRQAAEALAALARRRWVLARGGQYVDDITVAVAFL